MKSILSFLKKLSLLVILVCLAFMFFEKKSERQLKQIQTDFLNKNYPAVILKLKDKTFKPESISARDLQYLHWLCESQFQVSPGQSVPLFEILKQQNMSVALQSKAKLRLAEVYHADKAYDKVLVELNDISEKSGVDIFLPALLLKSKIEYSQKMYDCIDTLQKYLPASFETPFESEYLKLLGQMNIDMLFSQRVDVHSIRYRILPGDTLSKIADQFHTTAELIKKANQLTRSIIHPNNHLKITQAVFTVYVNKITNQLVLMQNGKFFKAYLVGTGKNDGTPAGEFMINSKQEKPTWYHPNGSVIPFGHAENFLGTHWMGINYPGYGIHGTWDPSSVGQNSSKGCIRLINEEVEELFTILPINTKIVISDTDIWKILIKKA